jgi:parallel beta-helix repeat protein
MGSGTTYYVDKDGDDANPGTEDAPWLTIQKAADTAQAGDTVYIKAGTYREWVSARNSGSEGDYISFAAYPGDTVTINGSDIDLSYAHGLFEIHSKSYIKVSGLRLLYARHGYGILVDSSDHVTVENCYTYDTYSSGIHIVSSSDITIDGNEVEYASHGGGHECITVRLTDGFEISNNHVHDAYKGDESGGEGIDVKQGCSNGKIHHNLVHDTARQGIYVDAWDSGATDIEVYGNLVYDSSGGGITVGSEKQGAVSNISIHDNVVYDCDRGITIATSGIVPGTSDYEIGYAGPMSNIRVVDNTVYNCGRIWYAGSGGIYGAHDKVTHVVIRNNIVSGCRNYQIARCTEGDYVVDHNVIDGPNSYDWDWHGMSWSATDGEDGGVGGPLFVALLRGISLCKAVLFFNFRNVM